MVKAFAIAPSFEYDRWLNTEQLIIALQSKFVKTINNEILLAAIGNIKEENVRNTDDEVFSQ